MAATMSARRDTVWTNASDAIAVERQIKGWSRAKKEALIRGDYLTQAASLGRMLLYVWMMSRVINDPPRESPVTAAPA